MYSNAYTMPASSGITMGLIRHQIPDIKRPIGNSVQHISLLKLIVFLAWKEDHSNTKQTFDMTEVRHIWRISNDGNCLFRKIIYQRSCVMCQLRNSELESIRGTITGKIPANCIGSFRYRTDHRLTLWGYSLAWEGTLVLDCRLMVWLTDLMPC